MLSLNHAVYKILADKGLSSQNPMILCIHDMLSGFSMEIQSSVKEHSEGKHSNFEPFKATLLFEWPIFSQEPTEGV